MDEQKEKEKRKKGGEGEQPAGGAAGGGRGGGVMAGPGLLEGMLGFDGALLGLMIATYIAMDSFGTATNVTGDGAVAVIVDAVDRRRR